MRLKDLVLINQRTLPEDTPGDYSFRYIDIGSVNSSGTIQNMEEMAFENAPSRARRIVQKNDVIVSTVRTYLRAIASIDFDAQDVVASTGFAVCTPKANVIPRYLHYALRCDKVMDEICKESIGISYPAINSTMLSSIDVPYFSIPEQRRIVAYLDEKTAAIDKRVELLEKKKEAVTRLKKSVINRAVTRGLDPNAKLKDSGVDWIGEVPDGWDVFTARYIFTEIKDKNTDGRHTRQLSFRYGKIVDKVGNTATTAADEEIATAYRIVKPDDIIINGLNLNFDFISQRIAIVCDEGIITSAYLAVRTNRNVMLPAYATYLFKAYDSRHIFHNYGSGLRKTLKFSDFKTLPIPCPSVPEQQQIADYLDAECAKLDAAVANLDKQIDAYRRLKRSLIDEVVTGKRKVG